MYLLYSIIVLVLGAIRISSRSRPSFWIARKKRVRKESESHKMTVTPRMRPGGRISKYIGQFRRRRRDEINALWPELAHLDTGSDYLNSDDDE